MEVILPYRKSKLTAYFSLVGIALAFVSLAVQWWYMGSSLPFDGFYGMVRIDGFALLFKAIFLIAAALAIGISTRFLDIEGEQHGEYYYAHSLCHARHDVYCLQLRSDSLYISLEVDGAHVHILVAFTKREKKSKRSRDEVLPARSFLIGSASLRACRYFTDGGIDKCRRYRKQSFAVLAVRTAGREWAMVLPALTRSARRTETAVAARHDRTCRRLVLQSRCCAISHVGA